MNQLKIAKHQRLSVKSGKFVLKVIFVFIITTSFNLAKDCSENDTLTYRVYNSCLDSLVFNSNSIEKIILVDSTFTFLGNPDKAIRKILNDSITYELHVNYLALNKNPEMMVRIKSLHYKNRMLYYSDVFNTLSPSAKKSSDVFWSELKLKYPIFKNIVSFSKVSFSKDKNYALLKMSDVSEELHGISYQVYLKREKKKYKIIYIK